MPDPSFLIYGANGFTGALIAERAHERGLTPILAGRSRQAVEALGARLGLPTRVFDLDAPEGVDQGIRGVRLVLHCAGPYSRTSRPMVDACLRAGVHYLDITGEIAVLEAVLGRDDEARKAGKAGKGGCVLLPAVGFDVVPTDCLAARLHAEMPDAVRLELAFSGGMKASPGTARSTVEGMHIGALVRRNGALVQLPAPVIRQVPFKGGSRQVMSLPWGDLATAFHSTGIPDITVYTVFPPGVVKVAPLLRFVAPVLRMPSTIRFLQGRAVARATGPTEEQRRTRRMSVWGRVENGRGGALEGLLDVPEAYELTVLASLASVERVLAGGVPPGATTPSKAFGPDFVLGLPGEPSLELIR
jgi:short subunit dehydrogenase-like uncharacterized protein